MKFNLMISTSGECTQIYFYADSIEKALRKAEKFYREMDVEAENVNISLSIWHETCSYEKKKRDD